MEENPSIEELREMYAPFMGNKELRELSQWTQPNSDVPFDEKEYRRRIRENTDILLDKIEEALKFGRDPE